MTVAVYCICLAVQFGLEVNLLTLLNGQHIILGLEQILEHVKFATADIVHTFDEQQIGFNGRFLALPQTQFDGVSLFVVECLEVAELVVAIFDGLELDPAVFGLALNFDLFHLLKI